ncbi:MAG: hypothetical protein R2774_15585 [Saprospiraceae bacterium]
MDQNRIAQLTALLHQDPNDTFVLFALAMEYKKADDLLMAEKIFLNLKSIDPEYIGLYFHFGKLYESLDDLERAKIVYQEGISMGKKIKDIHSVSELMSALQNMEMDE